jgi:hypothetical protein
MTTAAFHYSSLAVPGDAILRLLDKHFSPTSYEVHLRSKGVPGFRTVSALFAHVHHEKARWTHHLFSNL